MTPPGLPSAQTSTGPRRDSSADGVLCDSEAIDAARSDLDSQRRRLRRPACIYATRLVRQATAHHAVLARLGVELLLNASSSTRTLAASRRQRVQFRGWQCDT